jgi:hypothetical protein
VRVHDLWHNFASHLASNARIPPDYDALAKKYGGVSIKQPVTQNPWAVVSVKPDYSDQQKLLVAAWKLFGQERRAELLGKMSPEQKSRLRTLIERQTQQGQDWFIENAPAPSSEVNKGGIKLHFASHFLHASSQNSLTWP